MTSDLRLDWASAEAAQFACERWHYSGCTPAFKCVRVGVWESGKFIGVVLFGQGANNNIGGPFGVQMHEVCELTRIALNKHIAPVSRIGSMALRFLRRHCPGIRVVVSYADTAQGHHGGIYQAMGWIYTGESEARPFRVNGELHHPKSLYSVYGRNGNSVEWLREHVDPKAERIQSVKHRYVMPLDPEMRAQLLPQALPYPKRVADAVTEA